MRAIGEHPRITAQRRTNQKAQTTVARSQRRKRQNQAIRVPAATGAEQVEAGGNDNARNSNPAGEVGDEVLRKVAETVMAVSRRLRRGGTVGFWAQLVLSTVSAVILAFSILFKGFTKGTDAGLYFILIGMLASFLSSAWSFGYTRLARQLANSASDPTKAPPRAQVQSTLQFGVGINLLGLGATIVGLQATTGLLFAKTLSTAASNPYVVGGARNFNPVLALDIFLVQAAGNTLLSHFISATISLLLLRSLSQDQQQQQQQQKQQQPSPASSSKSSTEGQQPQQTSTLGTAFSG